MCECSKIKRMIEYVEGEIKSYSDPGPYNPEEYYIKCDAKVDILEDVLYNLQKLLKE